MSKFYPLDLCFYDKPNKQGGLFEWAGAQSKSTISVYDFNFETFIQNKKIASDSPLSVRDIAKSSVKEEFKENIVSNFRESEHIRKIFFEEIHHYLDFVRTKGDIQFGNEGEYETRDTEVNAKLQSALTTFENDILQNNYEMTPPYMEEFQEEWKDDFESFKDWFEEYMFSKKFLRKLSGDQYQRFINRLYGFWEDKVEGNLSEMLNEVIADSSRTYSYERTESNVSPGFGSFSEVYEFRSEENNYIIDLHGYQGDEDNYTVAINFSVPGYTPQQFTGEGNVIRILNTIVEIVKEFHKRHREKIDKYYITGAGNSDEKGDVSKRARIYSYIVKKLFPNADIERKHHDIIVYP